MRIADFGRFDAPVVLFGGAYSNIDALEALAEVAGERPVLSTGDLVAYGGAPAETVARFRALGWRGIAGNCERQIAAGAADCGCGFDAGSACDRMAEAWYPFAAGAVDAGARDWMSALPDIGVFAQGGRRYGVVHGGATDVARYLWPTSAASEFAEEIAAIEALTGPVDGVVAGHSGVAFHRQIGDHQWINAGAIGLPPHDGWPETRYAVLDGGDVMIERLAYDAGRARARMEAAGLTQGYEVALETGLWPSEDILPGALRR